MQTFEFTSNGKYTVTVDDNNVSITIKGLLNFINKGGSKGTKIIPIKSITAIQFKKPRITTGFIQFAYNGSVESKGGPVTAVKDENTVTFNPIELAKAEELVALIESKRHVNATPTTAIATEDLADQLVKLHGLVDAGILTKDEFEQKKKQLLNL